MTSKKPKKVKVESIPSPFAGKIELCPNCGKNHAGVRMDAADIKRYQALVRDIGEGKKGGYIMVAEFRRLNGKNSNSVIIDGCSFVSRADRGGVIRAVTAGLQLTKEDIMMLLFDAVMRNAKHG